LKVKHDVAEAAAHKSFYEAVRLLQETAKFLRGSDIQASVEAMKTEKAVTKAIELLKATGFQAPRKH
jgi:predicted metal-dependent hydrolase